MPETFRSRRIELWADVGGTFTDCFVVDGGSRASLKVLSSGRVRARVTSMDGSVVHGIWPHRVSSGFWIGARAALLGRGRDATLTDRSKWARVTDFDSNAGRLTLDRPIGRRNPSDGDESIELDAGLEAPVLAARMLLDVPLSKPLVPLDVRLGTTRGTNALLTRSGAAVALVTTSGFGDLLKIGEQNRPDLFALNVRKAEPLTRHVIEVEERLTADGEVLRPLDANAVERSLRPLLECGIDSLAICLLHAHVNDRHERMIEDVAQQLGFAWISRSSRVAPLIKLVARAETTVLDAYLNPVLGEYIATLRHQFGQTPIAAVAARDRGSPSTPGTPTEGSLHGGSPALNHRGSLRLMTSGGNLVDADAFHGSESILSGPAGGVVALGKIAQAYRAAPRTSGSPEVASAAEPLTGRLLSGGMIGLDMGGTSTDVSRYEGGVARQYESTKAGVRVLTPMMAIHTVAAGGGSICEVVAGRMKVGPASAGADPGPACYGRGGPLTVTDLNVVLGRLPLDRFPFPLDIAAAMDRLAEVNGKLGPHAFDSLQLAAEGFLRIAVTHMAEAARTVSTAQGSDPRSMTLVGFGGAAGGHLCEIADALAMTRIIDHRDSSLLSALGMGLADVGRSRSSGVYRRVDEISPQQWQQRLNELENQTRSEVASEWCDGMPDENVDLSRQVTCHAQADVRYLGTESVLTIDAFPFESLSDRFHASHHAAFGFTQSHRPIEVAVVRCEAILGSSAPLDPAAGPSPRRVTSSEDLASATTEVFLEGRHRRVAILNRDAIDAGHEVIGPAIIVDTNSTLVVQSGWTARKHDSGTFELTKAVSLEEASENSGPAADVVMMEIVARRFQGIADSMGELLRRTAVSVNVKERLDYSCAVFDRDGKLIANAPHVPVHLGAMGHTVRHLQRKFPRMASGDVYLSNHPYAGGSHLPDVTCVTPVFVEALGAGMASTPEFFVASRAHHAEIGGKSPGSMPADATCLAEEGVVIDSIALHRDGIDHTNQLRRLLSSGDYPSRSPETNLSDIAAQRAAGVAGSQRVREMIAELGLPAVGACVELLFHAASSRVADWIATLGQKARSFRDQLDDGTPIAVTWIPQGDRITIDFTGTAGVHPGCFNATPAIVTAATLYVLRVLIGGTLPLNDGILARVDWVLPTGLLNPPDRGSPRELAAVVAGNVETSMRIVDVLLGAIGVAAASQGTMNNVLIGDSSFGYYETIGGGSGATAESPGADGVHVHMTNTRITDPEVYEMRYPVRLWQFRLRTGSGGVGQNRGGDGLVREIEFLRPLSLSLITNRRGDHRPWGIAGGGDAMAGLNQLIAADGTTQDLPSWVTMTVARGDRLLIQTPGGGGWG